MRKISKAYLARYKLWDHYYSKHFEWYPPEKWPKCHGRFVREVCHFGLKDLPNLIRSPMMFANKFSDNFEPAAYDYLEAWHFCKVSQEKEGIRTINTSYYEQLDFVKNHIK